MRLEVHIAKITARPLSLFRNTKDGLVWLFIGILWAGFNVVIS